MHMHTQVQSVVRSNSVLVNIPVVRAEQLALGRAPGAAVGVRAVAAH